MTTRGVTIVVHADGDLESRQYRISRLALAAGKWAAMGVAVLVVLFFAFAGPISRSAATVAGARRVAAFHSRKSLTSGMKSSS